MTNMRWMVLMMAVVLVVGCDKSDKPLNPDPVDGPVDTGVTTSVSTDVTTAVGDGDTDDDDAGAVLVGTWDAVKDQNGDLPPGTLVFTYQADGTGTVVEEGTSTKGFSWTYDVDASTLHVETVNEDMLFTATFAGDELTLTMDEPAMLLVMKRMDDAGE